MASAALVACPSASSAGSAEKAPTGAPKKEGTADSETRQNTDGPRLYRPALAHWPEALGRLRLYVHVSGARPIPFSTADISIQLLMDTTNTLQEIESRMTARAFGAVHNPEKGPEVRRELIALLEVQDRTSPDGVI